MDQQQQTPEEQKAAFRARVATITDRQVHQQIADGLLVRMRRVRRHRLCSDRGRRAAR